MRTKTGRSFVLTSVIATIVVGFAGVPAARATGPSLSVSPSTALTDPQDVSIVLDGFTPGSFASVQVAECGNAYANATPLPSTPPTVFGVLDSVDCEVIGFLSQGNMITSPIAVAGMTGPNPSVHQTGIGTGNRSCIASPPAVAPCFVYVSTSVNLPTFPQTDITFANPTPLAAEPAATTTTVMAVGSPVAYLKTAHAFVHVTTADPTSRPDGTVHVFEDGTPIGSGTLDANATVSVAVGQPALGLHDLTASFDGNGSFASSDSTTPTVLSIIAATNISMGDASIVEGDTHAVRSLVFPLVLSKAPSSTVMVNYSIVAEGANPPTIGTLKDPNTEVVAATHTLTFKAGTTATVKYITVKTYGDTVNDGDKTFAVQLTDNPTNGGYVLRRPTGHGLIIDDDAPTSASPVISITNAAVPEGDVGGTHVMRFALTMSSPSTASVTVLLQASNQTAVRGTKTTGDWAGAINRKVVFKAGQVSKQVSISAFPELSSELDETMQMAITGVSTSGPPVSVGTHSVAVGTILSDE